jgi:2-oxoglutarate dehydrogenase E1 component
VAIVRIEQIAPFPVEHIKKVLSAYGDKVEYCWAQEEHENYGAWNFVYPRLKLLLKKPIKFYGRAASASTANGKLKYHKME